MSEAYEIIHAVLTKYDGLADALSRLTGKVAELFRSHGREPKSRDPFAAGNVSPVTHYVQYCRQYEAAKIGAGQMLNQRVYASLTVEFTEHCECPQKELHTEFLKESYDVLKQFAAGDFSECTKTQLLEIETDCDQLAEIAIAVKSHARALRHKVEMKRNLKAA